MTWDAEQNNVSLPQQFHLWYTVMLLWGKFSSYYPDLKWNWPAISTFINFWQNYAFPIADFSRSVSKVILFLWSCFIVTVYRISIQWCQPGKWLEDCQFPMKINHVIVYPKQWNIYSNVSPYMIYYPNKSPFKTIIVTGTGNDTGSEPNSQN